MAQSQEQSQDRAFKRAASRTLGQLGGARVAIAALLMLIGILFAQGSWRLPMVQDAERALYDLRVGASAPAVDTDDRITLVVYTEDTNRATGQISPVDRTVLAKALTEIDKLGAKAIGIDVLFDSPQDDDPLLKSALRAMQTPTFLAFASNETNPDAITYEQEADLTAYHDSVRTEAVAPMSILLETDSDNVARSWPRTYPGLPALLSLALSDAAAEGNPAFSAYTGPIRYRVPASSDRPVFDKLPIDLLAEPDVAPLMGDAIAGRYVLIGGDFADFDQFDTPFTRTGNPVTGERQTIGVEIHATMLAQLLDGARQKEIPSWALWVSALAVVLLGGLTAIPQGRGAITGLATLVQFSIFLVLPVLLEGWGVNTIGLPSVGWIAGWLIGYLAVTGALRVIGAAEREFAAGALGKYLPASVAGEIMKNPDRLRLHGEKRMIYCVFTDLEGFTKLTHAVDAETIASLLNDYLDRLSAVVLEYGGTLDKFVGDAVVAFWGAPIAYPDDAERAVRAARAMYEAGEAFREAVPDDLPKVGRTRVGLHYGEATVGNFGGEGRIQYTALGDAMNTAARLEAANKPLDTTALVSREVVDRLSDTALRDQFVPMGRVTLRGRSTPVEIYEPRPDLAPERRTVLRALVAAHEAGDKAAVTRFTQDLGESGYKGSEDGGGPRAPTFENALRNLLERLRQTDKGESYVLG